MEYGDVLMHGFLHKKSDFYSKAHISKNVWQKRWVVLDEGKLFYTRKSGASLTVHHPASAQICTVNSTPVCLDPALRCRQRPSINRLADNLVVRIGQVDHLHRVPDLNHRERLGLQGLDPCRCKEMGQTA